MTLSATSKKPAVCLVAISLGTGGSDRSCAQLSQMLTAEGFEVHIAVLNDNVKFDYSGSLLNLGALKKGKDTLLKRFQRDAGGPLTLELIRAMREQEGEAMAQGVMESWSKLTPSHRQEAIKMLMSSCLYWIAVLVAVSFG